MNKKIRSAIIAEIRQDSGPQVAQMNILDSLSRNFGIDNNQVLKEIRLMRDDGLIEMLNMQPEHWRLTSPGERSLAPLHSRIMDYVATHWLAIIAVIISLFALFKK